MNIRKLTFREKVLLIILGIVALVSSYILLFYIPNSEKIELLEGEIAQKSNMVAECQAMVADQKRMELKLEKFKVGAESRYPMPYYDNIQNVILILDRILPPTNQYAVDFSVKEVERQEEKEESKQAKQPVVERQTTIPFVCNNYMQVKDTLKKISSGTIPCLIQDLEIHEHDGTSNAIANVSYFEYRK